MKIVYQHIYVIWEYCFAIVLLLIVGGCLPQKRELTIGFSQCAGGDWREKMNREMQSEVRFYPGVNLEIRQANGDLQTQLRIFIILLKSRWIYSSYLHLKIKKWQKPLTL